VDAQARVHQDQQESPVAQVAQPDIAAALGVILDRACGRPLGVIQDLLAGLPGELRQALPGSAAAPLEQLSRAGQVGLCQAFTGQVLVEADHRREVQALGGGCIGFECVGEPGDAVFRQAAGWGARIEVMPCTTP